MSLERDGLPHLALTKEAAFPKGIMIYCLYQMAYSSYDLHTCLEVRVAVAPSLPLSLPALAGVLLDWALLYLPMPFINIALMLLSCDQNPTLIEFLRLPQSHSYPVFLKLF